MSFFFFFTTGGADSPLFIFLPWSLFFASWFHSLYLLVCLYIYVRVFTREVAFFFFLSLLFVLLVIITLRVRISKSTVFSSCFPFFSFSRLPWAALFMDLYAHRHTHTWIHTRLSRREGRRCPNKVSISTHIHVSMHKREKKRLYSSNGAH